MTDVVHVLVEGLYPLCARGEWVWAMKESDFMNTTNKKLKESYSVEFERCQECLRRLKGETNE